MSEETKVKFSDIEVGSYFRWGSKVYTKIYPRRPNSTSRHNAIGIIEKEALDPRCNRRESAWECSFDDVTMVTPTKFFISYTHSPDVAEKLEETTNYLVTISKRVMSDFPYGMGTELYFISEDVKNALDNIGGELAETFTKEIEKASLQNKLSRRKEIKEAIGEIDSYVKDLSEHIADYSRSINGETVIIQMNKIKKLLEVNSE